MHLVPGIVFPSSPAPRLALAAGAAFLPHCRMFPVEASPVSFLAGEDHERTRRLCEALWDPQVPILAAARGGHGALRLDRNRILETLRRLPKPIVGFSDITALHFLWSQAGVPSFFGPNVTQLPQLPEDHLRRVLSLLQEGHLEALDVQLQPRSFIPDAPIEAPLCGANLTVAAAAAGTPWSFSWAGKIVMLEEIREAAYRLDRMLWQLFHATDLAKAAALVLGDFTECAGFSEDWIIGACAQWAPGLPLFSGFPGGHGPRNLTFAFGVPARLEPSGRLRQSAVNIKGSGLHPDS